MVARILEGDFEIEGKSSWMYFNNGRFRFLDPHASRKPWWAKAEWIEYGIDDVATLDLVAVERVPRASEAPGLDPLGRFLAIVWESKLGGSRGFQWEFEIVFRDGKRVEAQTSGDDWEQLSRDCRVARREAQRRARREARRRPIESTPPPTPSRPSGGSSFDALGKPRAR